MKCTELMLDIAKLITVPSDIEINHITENSAKCKENSLFVCIKGANVDGHAYAEDAYNRGCRCFLAERPLQLPNDVTVYLSQNSELAFARLACRFYGNPSHKVKVIGITGTKGKTTVACLLATLLEKFGYRCGYIGTNGIRYGEISLPSCNTTPDAITLQGALSDMQRSGCDVAVVEISSQALMRYRADGTRFEACVFTNLFPDHIGEGEHCDFEHYRACKRRLFRDFETESILYHLDDPASEFMIEGSSARNLYSFGQASKAHYRIEMLDHMQIKWEIFVRLFGRHGM